MRASHFVALLSLAAAPAAAQQPAAPAAAPAHAGAFVVRLGRDTIAVERFSRTGNAYSVEQVRRSPRTGLFHTHLELTPAGEIGTIFLMHHAIGKADAPLLASWKLTGAAGDSATLEMKRGDSTRTRRIGTRAGMIPTLPQSFLPYELAAMRMRATAADSLWVTLLGPSGDTMSVLVRRLGADSMTFRLPFLTYRARVDAAGRILSLYQPLGTAVERVTALDPNPLAAAWSALDARGLAMGPLSPYDSAIARVGPARVTVHYSRPRARGRTIFGNIVPLDTVWRTGANAATVLATDRPLVIGGTAVPAGRYTLFTLPSRTSTLLIVNRETERDGEPLAGTAYDSAKDLARIPMRTTTLVTPVEPLTIEIVPGKGNAGTLRIVWDRREMTVPVEAR